eukprot:COSAG01_NODE_2295_length_7967_cov_3.577021_2_plen_124_part_00
MPPCTRGPGVMKAAACVLGLVAAASSVAGQAPPKKVHTAPCSIRSVFARLQAITSSKACQAGCKGGQCPPGWIPGRSDACSANCGAVFEPFWDQCGALLTSTKMGGVQDMQAFYKSCLASLCA